MIMRLLTRKMEVRHRRLEEQSLALHRVIARRVSQNPELLTSVRERLSKDIHSGRFSISLTVAMQEWLDLLDTSSLEQILELLVDQGEKCLAPSAIDAVRRNPDARRAAWHSRETWIGRSLSTSSKHVPMRLTVMSS